MEENEIPKLLEFIFNVYYKPGGEFSKKVNVYTLGATNLKELSLIDEPYFNYRGITLYFDLISQSISRKIKRKRVEVINLWKSVFNKLPQDFLDFQIQLLSLLLYMYVRGKEIENSYIKIAHIFDFLKRLTIMWEYFRGFYMERRIIAFLSLGIPPSKYLSKDKKEKKEIYELLETFHDFLSNLCLIMTNPLSFHKTIFSGNKGFAKLQPGSTYHISPTVTGIYFYKKAFEMKRKNKDISFSELIRHPLLNNIKEYFKILFNTISDIINNHFYLLMSGAGISFSVIRRDKILNNMSRSLQDELENYVASFDILENLEIISIFKWKLRMDNYQLEHRSLFEGLIRIQSEF